MSAEIQKLYIAYFNRPADPGGLTFWTKQLAAGTSMAQIANSFSASAEYQAIYNASSNFELVVKLYQNLFGRTPLAGEASWWSDQITTNGAVTITTIANQLASGTTPGSADHTAITNKISAATTYTAAIDTTEEIIAYKGTATFAKASAWLAPVKDAATLATAIAPATLNAAVADAVSSAAATGSTFTLTTNADNFTGTSGNDTFSGVQANLGALDSVSGGAGRDTLFLSLTAATNQLTSTQVSSIETLMINQGTTDNTGTGLVVTGVTGIDTVINSSSANAVIVTGLAAVGTVTVNNTAAATTLTYTEAAVAGTADAVSLNLNGATGTINLNTATANTAGIETINVVSSGLDSSATLATNDTAGLTAVNIAAGVATTVVLSTNITTTATTVNASASTGAVTISGFGAAAHTVTGGSAADTFTFAGNLGTTDVINGGGGTDVLSSTHANMVAIATGATFATAPVSIETLFISDDFGTTTGTISANLFGDAVTNLRFASQSTTDAAAFVSSGLVASTATGGNNIRFDGDLGANGGSYTIGITNAATPGTTNTVTLDMRGGATTATSTIVANGVENLIISTASATGTQLFNITDASLSSVVISGGQTLDIDGAALGAAVTSVNASGLTGSAALNVQLNNSAALGATITTAGGADLIVASSLADVISSGSGNDTITGRAGADIVNVGSGTDIFIATVTTSATADTGTFALGAGTLNSVSTVDFDVITGMGAGDTIRLTGYTTTGGTATAAGIDTDVVSGNTVATTGGITLADNSIHLIRGVYTGSSNTFVGSSTGSDTLFVFDAANVTTATAYAGIVVVGYTATTATITGTTGDVLFV